MDNELDQFIWEQRTDMIGIAAHNGGIADRTLAYMGSVTSDRKLGQTYP